MVVVRCRWLLRVMTVGVRDRQTGARANQKLIDTHEFRLIKLGPQQPEVLKDLGPDSTLHCTTERWAGCVMRPTAPLLSTVVCAFAYRAHDPDQMSARVADA